LRITIEFSSEKEVKVPIHYNYILQGLLYRNLSDKDYRNFLHQAGYRIDNKQFKLFTYSRLLGKFRMYKEEGKIGFMPPVQLVVSSPLEQFITDLAETLIKSEFNFLGDNLVEIKSINVHKNIDFGDKVKIKMLSPVVTYRTIMKDEKKYTNYYSPWNPEFKDIVRDNLLGKHEVIYGNHPTSEEFKIIPNGSQEQRFARIINYKGTFIKAYAGIYWLMGSPDLIKVAYDTGLGSKNSQGFGCWEVVG